ncbi:MAG: DUF2007 domain-containing protein [Deltaproteobacteria bacterium]|nr:DUF2007 domain-containing protein [Deltaproteobacteria bacterium]
MKPDETSNIAPLHHGEFTRRALITAALLAIYWWLHQVLTLPFVESATLENFADIGASRLGPFYGSLSALTMGFLGVEILSLVLPAGRRLRRQGVTGRRRLNLFALRLVIVISAAIGINTCIYLRGAPSPFVEPLLRPGRLPMLLVVLTGMAATMALYILAKAISRWGWGNGFCWLLLFFPGIDLAKTLPRYLSFNGPVAGTPLALTTPLLLLLVAALSAFFLRSGHQDLELKQGKSLETKLPAFPQGIVPVVIPLILLPSLPLSFYPWLSLVASIVCVLSLLMFRLFSGARQLETSLTPFATLAPGNGHGTGTGTGKALRRQSWKGLLVLLVAFTVLELDVEFVLSSLASHFSFALPFLLVAFSLDLFFEARLWLRQGPSTALLELDSPYLATFLQARLQQQGIQAQIRGLRYRQLYFFLEPLTKMELLVPLEQVERALTVVQIDQIQTV